MPLNRVVITGCGAVSPFGLGVPLLVDRVWQGGSGVRLMPEWQNIRGLTSHVAAPVPDFDVREFLPRSLRRTMGSMAVYATLAAQEAVTTAGLSQEFLHSGDVGVAIGSTTGSPQIYEDFYRSFLAALSIEEQRSGTFFKLMGHSCAANVCLALGINGEQWAPASACTSAAQAIGLGYLLIKNGRQNAMLCGGADEVHSAVTIIFDVMKAASKVNEEPLITPRPFDKDRDGVVCGGGSGILVLESLDSASRRGAKILCEILGFGHVNDSQHIANPHESSMERAMRNAMQEGNVGLSDIDYVNAHATGTQLGDIAESRAIHAVVGENVPVSSFKGHIGHTLGAAGGLETILTLAMLDRQQLAPTLHLKQPDPDCAPLAFVQSICNHNLNTVIKNNFALGGVNTSLVLKRWTS